MLCPSINGVLANSQNYACVFSLAIDDSHRVVLKSISEGLDCEHDYINATYIDVRIRSKNLTGEKQDEVDVSMCYFDYLIIVTVYNVLPLYTITSDTLGLFSRQEVHCYSR